MLCHPTGYRLSGFRIQSILGHCGFGITYRAVDEERHRDVVTKEYLSREVATRDRDSTVLPISESDREIFVCGLEGWLTERARWQGFSIGCSSVSAASERDAAPNLLPSSNLPAVE